MFTISVAGGGLASARGRPMNADTLMPVTVLLTSLAMAAFAANSLLARLALAAGAIDAVSFTAIRLASGAFALLVLLMCRQGRGLVRDLPGNWPSALFLLVYALAFALAYLASVRRSGRSSCSPPSRAP